MNICLINVWMGKFPNSFPLFLRTVQLNPSVDFYIITDQIVKWNIPNVFFINSDLNKVKKVFEDELKMKIKLEYPYKLCDYKPIWRTLISDKLTKYHFWGVVDLDIVLGDMRKFLTDELLCKYDKIFDAGILWLVKNSEDMNNLYKLSMCKDNMAYPYKEAFRTNYACYFDEYMGMSILGWQYKKVFRDQLTENLVQDFDWKKLNFASYITKKSFVFKWENGKLYRYITDECGVIINEEKPKELMLAHIQKRNMDITFDISEIETIQSFWIYPNCYQLNKPSGALYDAHMCEDYEKYIRKRDRKKKLDIFFRYGLLDYIPHYFRSRRIKKFINKVKKFY